MTLTNADQTHTVSNIIYYGLTVLVCVGLIDAHKAIQKLQKEKTNPSPVASQGLSTASSTVSSRQTASHTTKPENLFKWSNRYKCVTVC